jgi:tRNA (guanine-N7-)-methyltransferase
MNREHAKRLRRQMTDAERLLWQHLRVHRLPGEKFRRQQPIGNYVVDFVHFGARLIVEADGGQHADNQADAVRDAWLRSQGFKMLRFWNNEILTNITAVMEQISEEIIKIADTPLPLPLPRKGGGGKSDKQSPDSRRPIRSYVLRQGRMTAAQARALEVLWPRYGVDLGDVSLVPSALFGRVAPVILEIGFGNGDALVAIATARPECDFIGVEVHGPGVGSALLKLAGTELKNARVIRADGNDVLARLTPGSVHGIHLFFPDPWPKKRHHKRRLLQPEFAARLCDALAPNGYLHCSTDWQEYAAQMLVVLEATPGLVNTAGAGRYAERPVSRPVTRFEKRGRAQGRPVRDLSFRRGR